jgi:hypothetical protein
MKLHPAEVEALETSHLLIKYASESPRGISDQKVLTPIAAAWQARETDTWTPQVSAAFWNAYSELCSTLQPATVDTIQAQKPSEHRLWVLFGPVVSTRLPMRMANRFFRLLVILMLISTCLGLISGLVTKYGEDLQSLTKQGESDVIQTLESLAAVSTDLAKQPSADVEEFLLDAPNLPPETKNDIRVLRQRLQALYYVQDQVSDRLGRLQWLTFRKYELAPEGDLSRLPKLEDGYENVRSFYLLRRNVAAVLQGVFALNQFYYVVVPMLLGAMGACTYVLRLISDQVRDVTFSTTSPIRHWVRVLLGAIGGVAVGLGAIPDKPGLSIAALSFIVGYAVEPMFAAFDGVAAKFRKNDAGAAS